MSTEPEITMNLQYQLLSTASNNNHCQPQATGPGLSSFSYPRLCKPLIQVGQRFCRTTNAFGRVHDLLASNDHKHWKQLDDTSSGKPKAAHHVRSRQELLCIVLMFEDTALFNASLNELAKLACHIQTGINYAMREDLFRIEKGILNWITPLGCSLNPPLNHRVKSNRGFNHPRTGALLCPAPWDWSTHEVTLRKDGILEAGKHWPKFLYENNTFIQNNPWAGFLRSSLLVTAYKDIFYYSDSRSSLEIDLLFTNVTLPSIAYIATHVRHALSTARCFSPLSNDSASEDFYFSMVDFFDRCKDCLELDELQQWWNRQIFGA